MSETAKLLIDAGQTVILAFAVLAIAYFWAGSRSKDSSADLSNAKAIEMTANSYHLLASSLASFAESAKAAAEITKAHQQLLERNAAVIEGVSSTLTTHETASVVRNANVSAAIDALPGKIRLIMQQDSNQLMLQIDVALSEFLARLNTREDRAAVIEKIAKDTTAPKEGRDLIAEKQPEG
jgi:enolase